nr:hypothetical protein [uncultured Flavobacterium sp.]
MIELIESTNTTTKINDVEFKYFHILDFNDIGFSYGICEEGWVINDSGVLSLISWKDSNFIGFVRLLEMPFSDLVFKIEESLKVKKTMNCKWVDLFPISKITQTTFDMESPYWVGLSLDFLFKADFHSTELVSFFKKNINEKWISQILKHKMQKYINVNKSSSSKST